MASFPQTSFETIESRENRDFSNTHVLLARSLSLEELSAATKLTTLFVPFTGINKFPVKELKERGVVVSNSHGKADVVAERALTLALTAMGRVVEMHNLMKDKGIWLTRERWGGEHWYSLYHKKCGIYGMGHIGASIIALLRPFRTTIFGLERDREKGLADLYCQDLSSLAADSDVLFVAVPLSPETRGSIDKEILSNMKGKFIVNVGRGEVIDEEALYWALSNNVLAGGGIDVWYNYPEVNSREPAFPSRYPIHELPNVVMSPHAASHAIEAKDGYYRDTFDQLEHYLRQGKALRPVELDKYM
jgi:phosphoglycerate dehydrogenase-like enzyme